MKTSPRPQLTSLFPNSELCSSSVCLGALVLSIPGCGWRCVFPSPFWYLSASASVDLTSSACPSVLVFCVSIFYYYY